MQELLNSVGINVGQSQSKSGGGEKGKDYNDYYKL